MSRASLTYREAGVDLEAADRFVSFVRKLAQTTHGAEVLDRGDCYAGLYRLPLHELRHPLIAACCDGVGTKLLVARDCQDYRGIGQDLVAMNVNDLLPRGARPLFFLDYLAVGSLHSVPVREIAEGIAAACQKVGCALLGGETAELPDAYAEGDCDLAGFAVGLCDESQVPPGNVSAGDLILGLPSSGIHANGLSLARRILQRAGLSYSHDVPELPHSLGTELLIPTRLYVEPVLQIQKSMRIKAAAHITGGGLLGRAKKLCPAGLQLRIDPASYVRPAIFDVLARLGSVTQEELARTFNLGLGFLIITSPEEAEKLSAVSLPELRVVGQVIEGSCGVDLGYAHFS
jgi:phosphoribosylformylglycinamidine cyclo-ligase